ncbi:MAG: DUF1552 domain-containing protein [Pirellulales bacterium]
MSQRFRNLPRRTFLRGVGVAMGLPLLDVMLPRTVRAAGEVAKPPVRLAFVFFPNGAIMDSWTPTSTGSDYSLPATLAPLAAHRNDLLVLSGLAQDNGRAKGDGPGDHARSAASFLTGAHPVKTAGADIRVGMSVDQAAAEKIGARTRLPSLEVGIERGRQAGSCDSGYSCAYSNTISWKNSTTPVAKEINPRLVFERLFGAGAAGGKSAADRDFLRRSILDLVAEDARELQKSLGPTDRRKIDEYFTGVRELEQRIQRAEDEAREVASGSRPVPKMDLPEGVPSDLEKHIRLMYDLMVLSFKTDTTRVATFMLANEGSNRSYSMVGVNDGHHQLSHHQRDEEKVAKIQKIDQFLTTQFAYFLEQLKATPEGDGTLLDHSLVMYGSGLSDGNRHRHDDLPILLAGRGGGTVAPGSHVRVEKETPLNNLFLSLLDRVDAPIDQLGDSTGRLPLPT